MLSESQIENIAGLAAADFRNPWTHGLIRKWMIKSLRKKGIDPAVVKAEHLLMAHVIARAIKETGKRKFGKDDIVAVFVKATQLLSGDQGNMKQHPEGTGGKE